MCLQPIKLKNPTLSLSPTGGQPLQIKVACGKCAECIDIARNQWRFRAYFQSVSCLKRGGFVYFDTLTYNNASLPRLSHFIDIDKYNIHDFSVFNHNHFKDFLKNLRRQLDYHYNGAKFEYFITSEYGTDERYTHRPHYHILFYVYPVEGLGFVQFSEFVSKCWKFGRTDGIPYQPVKYVEKHIFSSNLNNDFVVKNNICNYVSKYVTKDSTFRSQLDKRINLIKLRISDDELIKELVRAIDMFHRQSQGFGVSFIDELDEEKLKAIYQGYVYMEDQDKVILKVPTPLYYKRKLFYDIKKRDDNTRYWQLNANGIEFQRKNLLNTIDNLTEKYYNIYYNSKPFQQRQILKYLKYRTLQNFAVYLVLYKGRMRTSFQFKLNNVECSLYKWLDTIASSSFSASSNIAYRVVENRFVYYYDNNLQLNAFDPINYKIMPYDDFINLYAFNEYSCPQFSDFDKLEKYFEKLVETKRNDKQNVFAYKEEFKKRLKQYNQNNHN